MIRFWRRDSSDSPVGHGELERFATGRAPCLVAAHGFGGTATELAPLYDRIEKEGFAIDAALLPGHGTTVERLQSGTFEGWVNALRTRAQMAADNNGLVVLLGFSMGSLVAMQIASERPAWLAGLVVLSNALTLRASSALPLGLWARTGLPMPDWYVRKPRAADLEDATLLRTLVSYDRHPLKAALEVFRAGSRVSAVVGQIGCPALVLHGRRDRVCPCRNATWLAEHLGSRDVTVRIFEKSAHTIACDAERDEVACEVVRFMSRFDGQTTKSSSVDAR
jgi:carboxylesterase